MGDLLLIEVAQRLKTLLRDEDTVSRMGGDEFILLLPNMNSDTAAIVAAQLIDQIGQPYIIFEQELNITTSIGIAVYPENGSDFETLFKCADTAMYLVKQDTRNDFRFFTPAMQQHSQRNMLLLNELRHAIARNELRLYYQPQISLPDEQLIGMEALIRWQHPTLGMISPAEFIPLAESSGLIISIGEWVLNTAIKQMKDWLTAGCDQLVVAVNLSAIQFHQPNLTAVVCDALTRHQLPAQYLELELTESVAMKEPQTAIDIINALYNLGIRISIDDFGTGYSSLSYLKKFNIHKLKIDQSFIRDLHNNQEDKIIVSTIINLANSLGLQTIAEGVETITQLDFLRQQGCDEIQGYYFSKPLPSHEMEHFMSSRQQ
jgi:predicted signal transduction protein with EAL and GGDEF domain